jgi:hypothetical protein
MIMAALRGGQGGMVAEAYCQRAVSNREVPRSQSFQGCGDVQPHLQRLLCSPVARVSPRMVTRTFCLAHIKEADRLAALCAPGAERDSLQRSADHWRIVLHMNEMKERDPPRV